MVEIEPFQREEHPYISNKQWHLIHGLLEKWVVDFKIDQEWVLEIGSGTGLLQDLVDQYVGIDFAHKASRYMKKLFCVASAESLPFADDSFQGAYSVWVLEHVQDPEKMLDEIRRVIVPGGTIFISAAFGIGDWVSTGINLRPLSELSFKDTIIRLSLPIKTHLLIRVALNLPKRAALLISYLIKRRPMELKYSRIEPNYIEFLGSDSDACISLDSFSLFLYFHSRGDVFLTKKNLFASLVLRSEPQIYIIIKPTFPPPIK